MCSLFSHTLTNVSFLCLIFCPSKVSNSNSLLPNNWNPRKHNIVVFNSSEDEFATIGPDFEKYKLFGSQLEGLIFIKEELKDNPEVQVTLRIHPNLSNIKYKYVSDLYQLRSKNFNIISADSNVSSYALLENADTVIVFGSTIGIEAVYWKKPTILLGGSMYYKLNCTYTPKTHDQLKSLLIKKLEPMDNIQAIKFGYYRMNEFWEKPQVVDFRWKRVEYNILGKKFKLTLHNWKKIMNSRHLYTIYYSSKYLLIKLLYSLSLSKRYKYEIPIKENTEQIFTP